MIWRAVEDKEKLVTERHRYNLESVDGKIMQKEFVVASPQQQQVIANFTTSSTERHLVLEGPAGTGKTLVALQVANKLMESAKDNCTEKGKEPLLVVTAQGGVEADPIMKYLNASTRGDYNKIFQGWSEMRNEFGCSPPMQDTELLQLCKGLSEKARGRQIVLLVDEIYSKNMLSKIGDQGFPDMLRMILILNPIITRESPLNLTSSFLRVTLTSPYRSTIAVTRLARFIAKCRGLVVPEGEFGSDVEGTKPIFFDAGTNSRKMAEALDQCGKHLGDNVTILYDRSKIPLSMKKMVLKQGKEEGGRWDYYKANDFYGWEAQKVVAVFAGDLLMEQITRAMTNLAVILVNYDNDDDYSKTKEHFQRAAKEGLVDIVNLAASKVALDEDGNSQDTNDGQEDSLHSKNKNNDYLDGDDKSQDTNMSQNMLLCFSGCHIL